MRSVVAVLLGYAVFAVSAVALFTVSGYDPHSKAPAGFVAFAVAWGSGFGVAAGFVAAWVARAEYWKHALAVGCTIAVGATLSMIARPGQGSLWTQLCALLVFAPLTLVGGLLRARLACRTRNTS